MLKTMIYIKKDKAKINGECPIYIKILFKKKTTTISTGKYITEERWSETNNLRQILRNEKEKVIKEYLNLYVLKIEKLYNQLEKYGDDINIKEFKSILLDKEPREEKPTILDIISIHNSHFSKLVSIGERSPASLQKYERVKELVRLFNLKTYGSEIVLIDAISSAYVYNLESYMKFESEYKGKVGIKNNSVVKYFKTFKTVCNFAIKLELISKNPFSKYDGKLQIKDAIYLTQDELNKIEEKAFGIDRLERVKDIFLFSCYTGYAPIDAENLKQDNLITNNDGDLWIVTDRVKTGIRANVPVLPTVKRIIDKYEGLQFGLIPKISNQKMNAYLKEIADICGIKKNLTWYVSRHTFATTITLGNGIKLENVSAMMGHSNIKQTQHYAKVLDSSVFEDMKRLKTKYK